MFQILFVNSQTHSTKSVGPEGVENKRSVFKDASVHLSLVKTSKYVPFLEYNLTYFLTDTKMIYSVCVFFLKIH